MCCSPWGHKELDTIEGPNNNNKSNKKTKVKIKETDLSWSQNWLFLPNTWTNAEHVVLLKCHLSGHQCQIKSLKSPRQRFG